MWLYVHHTPQSRRDTSSQGFDIAAITPAEFVITEERGKLLTMILRDSTDSKVFRGREPSAPNLQDALDKTCKNLVVIC